MLYILLTEFVGFTITKHHMDARDKAVIQTAGTSALKKTKHVSSVRKVVATAFWNTYGVVLINYLEKGKQSRKNIVQHSWSNGKMLLMQKVHI